MPYQRVFGVAGNRVLSATFDGTGSSPATYDIINYRTGQSAYRITADRVWRGLSGAAPHGTLSVPLNADGSLSVEADSPQGRKGLQPLDVGPQGQIRRVGHKLSNATGVTVKRGHGRVFVAVGGKVRTRSGKQRECGGNWMTNSTGSRGIKIHGYPTWWDGKTAVFDRTDAGEPSGADDRITVRRDLARLKLRSSQVPGC